MVAPYLFLTCLSASSHQFRSDTFKYQEESSGESLTCFWLYQTSLAIITLILKVNKIQWQHITFWANDPLSPDIAGPLMIRGVLAHQIWPGHLSAFTFITKQLHYLHFLALHVQLHFFLHFFYFMRKEMWGIHFVIRGCKWCNVSQPVRAGEPSFNLPPPNLYTISVHTCKGDRHKKSKSLNINLVCWELIDLEGNVKRINICFCFQTSLHNYHIHNHDKQTLGYLTLWCYPSRADERTQ